MGVAAVAQHGPAWPSVAQCGPAYIIVRARRRHKKADTASEVGVGFKPTIQMTLLQSKYVRRSHC